MFEFIILTILSLISLICTLIIISSIKSKSLGSQTLFDLIVINLLIAYQSFVWNFTFLCYATLYPQGLSEDMAKIIMLIFITNGINVSFFMLFVPTVKYMLIYHPIIFDSISDNDIITNLRKYSMLLSISLGIISCFAKIQPIESYAWFYRLTGEKMDLEANFNGANIFISIIFSLTICFYLFLQIRLEIDNFKNFEGMLYKVIKRIIIRRNSNNYPLENENNDSAKNPSKCASKDYSILFQRILSFFCGIMFFYFMKYQNGLISENVSTLPKNEFIQILFANLLFVSMIVENPKIRQRIERFLCKNNDIYVVNQ